MAGGMCKREEWMMIAADPRYAVGAVVSYEDHHGRFQVGEVRAIEAHWRSSPIRPPLIIYDLSHPTYRNKRFYATDKNIHGLSNRRPTERQDHD